MDGKLCHQTDSAEVKGKWVANSVIRLTVQRLHRLSLNNRYIANGKG